ncbi:HlyD family efflux transporter periplasmic adaptor subunit [Phormidesmis sp. 146-33]
MTTQFDQPVILQRSPFLSRAIVWGIVSVTTFSLVWAGVAKVEEAIPATGKLEPQGSVKEIQAPVNGVVKAVYVKEGQSVNQGDLLLTLDSTSAQAQLTSLQKIRTGLIQEKQFYQAAIAGSMTQIDETVRSPELAALTKNRLGLVSENQLYRSQLNDSSSNLTADQQLRLRASQQEKTSRTATAQLETEQLKRQLQQTQTRLASAQDIAAINQGINRDLEPVAREGGISRIQFLKQQQELRTNQAEVTQLIQEEERLKLAIAQSDQRLKNTIALSTQDIWVKITDNEKKIAEIDSQLNKAIVENQKKITEIDGQLSQTQVTLKYQELRAPADGTIFDLKAANPGFVVSSTEPILKVVPNNALTAKIFITNQDIGFVKEGMPVDVRIDSFPFNEFGDIKGQLVAIGSDALPPTQIRPFYSFPATIRLDQQSLTIQGRTIPLQSGMSLTVNIKVRQRPVINILLDGMLQKVESVKSAR